MSKYAEIANAIHERVRHGDYRLRGFPSHAGLVAELGVNSRTVAKALSSLVDQGILVRHESGRIELAERSDSSVRHIGVISPPHPSENIMRWQRLIHDACHERGWVLKPIAYSHWHDMAITEALRGTDGLFFLSIGDDFPELVVEQIRSAQAPVVVLEQDMSAEGIPSVRYCNPNAVSQLMVHLKGQGYRRAACLNTQPMSRVIGDRIRAWQLWSSAQEIQGPVFDEPVPLFRDAAEHAHEVVSRLLRNKQLDADAIVCTTPYIAMGAMRAVVDAGLRPGADIGVASVEEWTGMVKLLSPSLTCLTPPPMMPVVQVCLDYFERSDRQWIGPMLIEPASMELFEGESTRRE